MSRNISLLLFLKTNFKQILESEQLNNCCKQQLNCSTSEISSITGVAAILSTHTLQTWITNDSVKLWRKGCISGATPKKLFFRGSADRISGYFKNMKIFNSTVNKSTLQERRAKWAGIL